MASYGHRYNYNWQYNRHQYFWHDYNMNFSNFGKWPRWEPSNLNCSHVSNLAYKEHLGNGQFIRWGAPKTKHVQKSKPKNSPSFRNPESETETSRNNNFSSSEKQASTCDVTNEPCSKKICCDLDELSRPVPSKTTPSSASTVKNYTGRVVIKAHRRIHTPSALEPDKVVKADRRIETPISSQSHSEVKSCVQEEKSNIILDEKEMRNTSSTVCNDPNNNKLTFVGSESYSHCASGVQTSSSPDLRFGESRSCTEDGLEKGLSLKSTILEQPEPDVMNSLAEREEKIFKFSGTSAVQLDNNAGKEMRPFYKSRVVVRSRKDLGEQEAYSPEWWRNLNQVLASKPLILKKISEGKEYLTSKMTDQLSNKLAPGLNVVHCDNKDITGDYADSKDLMLDGIVTVKDSCNISLEDCSHDHKEGTVGHGEDAVCSTSASDVACVMKAHINDPRDKTDDITVSDSNNNGGQDGAGDVEECVGGSSGGADKDGPGFIKVSNVDKENSSSDTSCCASGIGDTAIDIKSKVDSITDRVVGLKISDSNIKDSVTDFKSNTYRVKDNDVDIESNVSSNKDSAVDIKISALDIKDHDADTKSRIDSTEDSTVDYKISAGSMKNNAGSIKNSAVDITNRPNVITDSAVDIKGSASSIREGTVDQKDSISGISNSVCNIKGSGGSISDSEVGIKDSANHINDIAVNIKSSTSCISNSAVDTKDISGNHIMDNAADIKGRALDIKDSVSSFRNSASAIKNSAVDLKSINKKIRDNAVDIESSVNTKNNAASTENGVSRVKSNFRSSADCFKYSASIIKDSIFESKGRHSNIKDGVFEFNGKTGSIKDGVFEFNGRIDSIRDSVFEFKGSASGSAVDIKDSSASGIKDGAFDIKYRASSRDGAADVKSSAVSYNGSANSIKDTAVDSQKNASSIKDSVVDIKSKASSIEDNIVDNKSKASNIKDSAVDMKSTARDMKDSAVDMKGSPSKLIKDSTVDTADIKDIAGSIKDITIDMKVGANSIKNGAVDIKNSVTVSSISGDIPDIAASINKDNAVCIKDSASSIRDCGTDSKNSFKSIQDGNVNTGSIARGIKNTAGGINDKSVDIKGDALTNISIVDISDGASSINNSAYSMSSIKNRINGTRDSAANIIDRANKDSAVDTKIRTNDIRESAVDIKDKAKGIKDSAIDTKDRTSGTRDSAVNIKDRARDIRDRDEDIKKRANDIENNAVDLKDKDDGIKNNVIGIKKRTSGIRENTIDIQHRASNIRDSAVNIQDRTNGIKGGAVDRKDKSSGIKNNAFDIKNRMSDIKDSDVDIKDMAGGIMDSPVDIKDRASDSKDSADHIKHATSDNREIAVNIFDRTSGNKDGAVDIKDRTSDKKDSAVDMEDKINGNKDSAVDIEEKARDINENSGERKSNTHGIKDTCRDDENGSADSAGDSHGNIKDSSCNFKDCSDSTSQIKKLQEQAYKCTGCSCARSSNQRKAFKFSDFKDDLDPPQDSVAPSLEMNTTLDLGEKKSSNLGSQQHGKQNKIWSCNENFSYEASKVNIIRVSPTKKVKQDQLIKEDMQAVDQKTKHHNETDTANLNGSTRNDKDWHQDAPEIVNAQDVTVDEQEDAEDSENWQKVEKKRKRTLSGPKSCRVGSRAEKSDRGGKDRRLMMTEEGKTSAASGVTKRRGRMRGAVISKNITTGTTKKDASEAAATSERPRASKRSKEASDSCWRESALETQTAFDKLNEYMQLACPGLNREGAARAIDAVRKAHGTLVGLSWQQILDEGCRHAKLSMRRGENEKGKTEVTSVGSPPPRSSWLPEKATAKFGSRISIERTKNAKAQPRLDSATRLKRPNSELSDTNASAQLKTHTAVRPQANSTSQSFARISAQFSTGLGAQTRASFAAHLTTSFSAHPGASRPAAAQFTASFSAKPNTGRHAETQHTSSFTAKPSTGWPAGTQPSGFTGKSTAGKPAGTQHTSAFTTKASSHNAARPGTSTATQPSRKVSAQSSTGTVVLSRKRPEAQFTTGATAQPDRGAAAYVTVKNDKPALYQRKPRNDKKLARMRTIPASKSETYVTPKVQLIKEKPSHDCGARRPRGTITFDDDVEDICVICHEPLTSLPQKLLDCGHVFHSSCIVEWTKRDRTCPFCRAMVLLDEDFPRLGAS